MYRFFFFEFFDFFKPGQTKPERVDTIVSEKSPQKMADLLVKCCANDCKHRGSVQRAIRDGSCFPHIPECIVKFECTKCATPMMHEDCYYELEGRLCNHISSKRTHLKPSDIVKCVWDKGRSGLYKHALHNLPQLIMCNCGGTLCAATNGRGNVIGLDNVSSPKTSEKKRRKKREQQLDMKQPLPLRFDEEQKQYIFKRPTAVTTINIEEQALPTLDDFPSLKPENTSYEPELDDTPLHSHTPVPMMTIKGFTGFHVLTVDRNNTATLWRPILIGKAGSGLKALRTKYPDVRRIHIDVTVNRDHERIVIEGGSQESRLDCAIEMKRTIEGILHKKWS